MDLTFETRLLRFLMREEDAERRGHRDLRALPADARALEGECIPEARFVGRDRDAFLFEVPDNASKFRGGDPLAVGDGDDLDSGWPLLYGGYDARRGVLRLLPDPYDRGDEPDLQPGQTYCLDRRPLDLRGRLRDAVGAAFADPLLRAVLLGQHTVAADFARTERAARHLEQRGLNPAQVTAGARAIGTESLALVQGPPGTGKTRLLAEVVAALGSRGCRIALCAFTHRGVDNALLAIRRAAPDLPLCKVGSGREGGRELRAAGIGVVDPRRGRLPETGVVAGTCFQLAKLPDREKFHFAVFDEAGQLPIPHALPGMLLAQRWMFFGDHRQLPPVVKAEHRDREACASVFEHLHGRYGSALLDTTYRMNHGLCRVVSETFYGGALHSEAAVGGRRLPFCPGGRLDEVLDPEHAVTWLRVDHRQPGQRSPEEAAAVADVVEDLLRQHGLPPDQVAVIAPFRAQGRLSRTALQHKQLAGSERVVVDTVERMQGQEREAVVISLGAGDPGELGGRSEFFFSENRLNVALSRARTKAVLVCSEGVFRALPMAPGALRVASLMRGLRGRIAAVDLTALYAG